MLRRHNGLFFSEICLISGKSYKAISQKDDRRAPWQRTERPPKRWGSAGQGAGEEPQEGHERDGWRRGGEFGARESAPAPPAPWAAEVARGAPGAWGPPLRGSSESAFQ